MIHTELIAPIGELIRRQAQARPGKIAYRDARKAITYGELATVTANLSGHLQDLGLAPGDSVAILLPNSVEWVESCFAINRAGAISVPISYDSTTPEIAYRLADAGCKAIITTTERAELVSGLQAQMPALKTQILIGAGNGGAARYMDFVAKPAKSLPRDPQDMDRPAFIVYTSGTTGRAKGVILSLRRMLWVAAASWVPIMGLSESDTVLSPLPLFHSYALNLSVLGILAVGATEHILERYSTNEVLAQLRTGQYTFLPGVPTMFHYLLEATRAEPAARFPGLRLCFSAGAIMPAALNREFEQHFGVKLLDGYGITETCTMVTSNWQTGSRVLGSCGLPIPGVLTRIVDPATGKDVQMGAEGELIVSGPLLMLGYHNKPAETAQAIREGWYHTGDLAKADANGYITITGRLKELIIRGGQNIAPAEIEEVVIAFAGVLDCAALGVAHEHLGEVPVVFVVPRENARIDAAGLIAHCATQLSAYKLPHAVHIVAAIPRTGSGKIMRFKLREILDAPPRA